MAKKYFTKGDDEHCYPLSSIKETMREHGIETQEVVEAKAMTGNSEGFFYCQEFMAMGEKGGCGKQCEAYAPRNGKNGRCKHHSVFYEETEITKTIKIKLKTQNQQ